MAVTIQSLQQKIEVLTALTNNWTNEQLWDEYDCHIILKDGREFDDFNGSGGQWKFEDIDRAATIKNIATNAHGEGLVEDIEELEELNEDEIEQLYELCGYFEDIQLDAKNRILLVKPIDEKAAYLIAYAVVSVFSETSDSDHGFVLSRKKGEQYRVYYRTECWFKLQWHSRLMGV